jgi:hypothetical protein
MSDADAWRRCSACKGPIAFGTTYWACNVSTCNRPRTGLVFCSVSCWDAHLGVVRHRESWAVERKSPTRAEWEREQARAGAAAGGRDVAAPVPDAAGAAPDLASSPPERSPRRILPAPVPRQRDPLEREILVVASKLKSYVRARSGFHTSDRCVEPLSDALREMCDRAIEKARAEGRRTVLERDFD